MKYYKGISYAIIAIGIIITAMIIPIGDKSDITARTTVKYPLSLDPLQLYYAEINIFSHTLYHLPTSTEIGDSYSGLFPVMPAIPGLSTGELSIESTANNKTVLKKIGKLNRGFMRVSSSTITDVSLDKLKLVVYEDNKIKITKEISLT